jgi:lipopolysaccharide/colanic/teichoic acid biosynthesis glycosyltransferase
VVGERVGSDGPRVGQAPTSSPLPHHESRRVERSRVFPRAFTKNARVCFVKTGMLVTLLIGVVARFMGDEVKSWSTWLHKSIRRIAVAKLPNNLRERYREEWEGGLEDFPGEIFKLFYSVGLLRAALEIHKAAQETTADHRAAFGSIKRLFDVLFSAATILAVLPCLLTIAIAIKIDSEGPLFSLSKRVGKKGRPFQIAKFRTVRPDNEAQFTTTRMRGWRDEVSESGYHLRVTRVGRFLRRYSLDELPVLFSIIKGDMSLVGPRPRLFSEVPGYDLIHLRCFDVSPGVTGPWALQGRRDQGLVSSQGLDEIYANQRSIWLDFKIFVRTMGLVLTRRD